MRVERGDEWLSWTDVGRKCIENYENFIEREELESTGRTSPLWIHNASLGVASMPIIKYVIENLWSGGKCFICIQLVGNS